MAWQVGTLVAVVIPAKGRPASWDALRFRWRTRLASVTRNEPTDQGTHLVQSAHFPVGRWSACVSGADPLLSRTTDAIANG